MVSIMDPVLPAATSARPSWRRRSCPRCAVLLAKNKKRHSRPGIASSQGKSRFARPSRWVGAIRATSSSSRANVSASVPTIAPNTLTSGGSSMSPERDQNARGELLRSDLRRRTASSWRKHYDLELRELTRAQRQRRPANTRRNSGTATTPPSRGLPPAESKGSRLYGRELARTHRPGSSRNYVPHGVDPCGIQRRGAGLRLSPVAAGSRPSRAGATLCDLAAPRLVRQPVARD
jgi:hypothetical protein